MNDEYDFVDQTRMPLDMDGGSPFARCVIPKDADPQKVLAAIRTDVRAAFERHCLFVRFQADELASDRGIVFFAWKPGEIKPREVEAKALFDVQGIDITGGMESSEYVRMLRGE